MPNLDVPHHEISSSSAQRGRAEANRWPRSSTQQVLINKKGGSISSDNDAHVVTKHRGRRAWSLGFPQSLEVLRFLTTESCWRRASFTFRLWHRSSLYLRRRSGCDTSPIDLRAPGACKSGCPKNEAFMRAVALAHGPQTLAEEGSEDAIGGILHCHDTRPRVFKLPVHRAQGDTIHCHAVSQDPPRSDLEQDWQTSDNAGQQITTSFGQDQACPLVDACARPLWAFDH